MGIETHTIRHEELAMDGRHGVSFGRGYRFDVYICEECGFSEFFFKARATLTGLALGPHNIIVYANDTHGNMGSSDKVYFTITKPSPPVDGIYIPVNKLELLAPYIRLTILLAVAVSAVVYVKIRKRELK